MDFLNGLYDAIFKNYDRTLLGSFSHLNSFNVNSPRCISINTFEWNRYRCSAASSLSDIQMYSRERCVFGAKRSIFLWAHLRRWTFNVFFSANNGEKRKMRNDVIANNGWFDSEFSKSRILWLYYIEVYFLLDRVSRYLCARDTSLSRTT